MTKANYLDYDKKNDILYVGFGDRSNSFGDEADSDFTIMRDFATNKIVGLIVWDFGNKYKSNSLPPWPKGIEIDASLDILSQIDL